MRQVFAWILYIACLYQAGVSADVAETVNCVLSAQMENQCASYCYRVIKPFLQIAHQSHEKDAKIADLLAQLAELKVQLAKHTAGESQNNELHAIAANIDEIKQLLVNAKIGNLQNENIKMLQVPGHEAFPVLYNNRIAGPGWIVVQQRLNGAQDFYHNWAAYRDGFGTISEHGEFFIGLEKLHQMLSQQPHELYISMEHVDERVRYARYDNFNVGSEQSGYKLLSLGQYSGNASDALRRNEHMKFTTFDRDNDKHATANCARYQQDAWWHDACSDSNLNGIYDSPVNCIYWHYPLKTNGDCLRSVIMLIRPKAAKSNLI